MRASQVAESLSRRVLSHHSLRFATVNHLPAPCRNSEAATSYANGKRVPSRPREYADRHAPLDKLRGSAAAHECALNWGGADGLDSVHEWNSTRLGGSWGEPPTLQSQIGGARLAYGNKPLQVMKRLRGGR